MNISWDADRYASDFSFVHQYGNDVMALLDAAPGAAVLDLGCGNGALSGALRDRGYRVTGLDTSGEQLAAARRAFPDIPFLQADAAGFSLPEPVDAVFSNAVLHWIDRERQPDMMRCVHRALRQGGQFVFELGGHGNNRLIHGVLAEVFAEHGYVYQMPFCFPTIGEYAGLLEQAGFQTQYAVLFDRPTELKGENGLRDWIAMFLKAPFSVIGDGAQREAVMAEAAEQLRGQLYRNGRWYADYVRLRMKAVKL